MTSVHDIIKSIAREELFIETLEPRGRDHLDFHDVSVRSVEVALKRAYEAGRASRDPIKGHCPGCGLALTIRP